MYSHQTGRPAVPPKAANRYIKGRLPDGVGFAAYPGRSSTPLPTAESKSAERINQLKIWNEAATNDDKRRLGANKPLGINASAVSTARRTDSFKKAKDRHSASFHSTPSSSKNNPELNTRTSIRHASVPANPNKDMFADRSDSESDEENVQQNHPVPEIANNRPPQRTQPPPQYSAPAYQPLPDPPANPSDPNASHPAAPSQRPVSASATHNVNHSPESFPPVQQPKTKSSCCTIM